MSGGNPILDMLQSTFAPQTRWPVGAGVLAGLAVLALSLAASVLGWGQCIVASGLAMPDNPTRVMTGPQTVRCDLIAMGLQQATFIALTLVVASFYTVTTREAALHLAQPAGGAGRYALALVLLLGALMVFNAVYFAVDREHFVADLTVFLPMIRSSDWLLALLVIGVGAPLSEELFFRGFLLPVISRSRLGFKGAAVLTTLGWTALHFSYSVIGMLEVFLIGLFFCSLVWWTNSLRIPIVCHALYNSLFVVVLRLWPASA